MPEAQTPEAATAATPVIQFNKYNVVNKTTGAKARITYSRWEGVVTLMEKDYARELPKVFNGVAGVVYQNDTDTMTDYFDHGRIRIKADHPLYEAALARCR